MVNGIRLQKPSPNALTAAVGVAPNANAASATTTTPSAANTQASGNQRSAQAALRKAARAIHPSCDAFMRFSVGDRDIVAPRRSHLQADQGRTARGGPLFCRSGFSRDAL